MKKVKFNTSAVVNMRPDEINEEYQRHYKEMRWKDFKSFKERLGAGSEHERVNVKARQVIDVPDWYYEENKNIEVSVGNSFDKYTDEFGRRVPFSHAEALRHGDIRTPGETMKTVKMFDLVEDLNHKSAKKAS